MLLLHVNKLSQLLLDKKAVLIIYSWVSFSTSFQSAPASLSHGRWTLWTSWFRFKPDWNYVADDVIGNRKLIFGGGCVKMEA